MEPLWTLRQVCDYLKLSECSVRRRIAEARRGVSTFPLPVQGKKREKLLFDPIALRRWVEAQQVTPQPTIPINPVTRKQQDKDYHTRQQKAASILAAHAVNRRNTKHK